MEWASLARKGSSGGVRKKLSECFARAQTSSGPYWRYSSTTHCIHGKLTITSPLVTDPRRTATPAKLRRVQDVDGVASDDEGALSKAMSGSEHVRQGAERAINSVARKLDPYLSVEYTVNELINAARDPANLARIFDGKKGKKTAFTC